MYKIIGADGKEYGPVTSQQLRQWRDEGRVNLETRVLPEGETDWKRLGDVAEFQSAPGPQTAPPGFRPVGISNAPYVPNYLTQSVLVTLCCCVPVGIAALIHAAQVKTKLQYGDVAGAQESSGKAKLWCWIGFGLGIIIMPFYVMFMFKTGRF
jgi:hypothetical protein